MTLQIASLRKESSQFPTQWVGETDEGVGVYIRYRATELSIQTGERSPVDDHTSSSTAISASLDLSNEDIHPGRLRDSELKTYLEKVEGIDISLPDGF